MSGIFPGPNLVNPNGLAPPKLSPGDVEDIRFAVKARPPRRVLSLKECRVLIAAGETALARMPDKELRGARLGRVGADALRRIGHVFVVDGVATVFFDAGPTSVPPSTFNILPSVPNCDWGSNAVLNVLDDKAKMALAASDPLIEPDHQRIRGQVP